MILLCVCDTEERREQVKLCLARGGEGFERGYPHLITQNAEVFIPEEYYATVYEAVAEELGLE